MPPAWFATEEGREWLEYAGIASTIEAEVDEIKRPLGGGKPGSQTFVLNRGED